MIDTWTRANQIIPGGNHLFSKTPDRYCPGAWPPYFKQAQGIEILASNGRKFKDFSVMGAGNSTLGYCDPDVDFAVKSAIIDGNVSTLNCPEEVELAEVMLKLNPKMDMVRFGRSGNDACQIALRIAREYSGKRKFAICGYHGWEIGHPPQLDPECMPFDYGDIEWAKAAIQHPHCAAVMMECVRNKPVDVEFLKAIREECGRYNIPLIFDEVASGFRCNLGGYHQLVGVQPDIALYGKAMGNGYAISAVVGKQEFMEKAKNTFISSMFWSERIGYAAGLATIEKMRKVNAQQHMMEAGAAAKRIWQGAAKDAGLHVEVSGLDPLATWAFKGDDDRRMLTLFTQEMLKRGYLAAGQFYPSVMHKPEDIMEYHKAVITVFNGISDGSMVLEGEPARAGFKRLA
jgi:glutamate-1-semialdehyde aminotransferase